MRQSFITPKTKAPAAELEQAVLSRNRRSICFAFTVAQAELRNNMRQIGCMRTDAKFPPPL